LPAYLFTQQIPCGDMMQVIGVDDIN